MKIEIDTTDRALSSDLVRGAEGVEEGQTVDIPGGAKLTVIALVKRYAVEFPETIEAILTFGSGVASGVVASWLYDKLKGRATTLRIEETEVQIDKGEIQRIISRKIEKKG